MQKERDMRRGEMKLGRERRDKDRNARAELVLKKLQLTVETAGNRFSAIGKK